MSDKGGDAGLAPDLFQEIITSLTTIGRDVNRTMTALAEEENLWRPETDPMKKAAIQALTDDVERRARELQEKAPGIGIALSNLKSALDILKSSYRKDAAAN